MNPVLVALLISMAGNGLLGWLYLGKRDETAVARTQVAAVAGERDGAREQANACSDATEDLRTLADRREAEAAVLREKAKGTARGHNQRADVILSTPPPVPGNDCASAQARVSGWIKGRALP